MGDMGKLLGEMTRISGHVNVTLGYLKEAALAGHQPLDLPDGTPAPKEVALKAIQAKQDEGYTYWPVCDSIAPDGSCIGHDA